MNKKSLFLTVLLYSLPILFFIVCYFLIITSGEDIHQGANTPPNIIQDSIDAFNHSTRLADMYAWSIINFFDYRFSFGPDTILRLLDVTVAISILYMMTYIALARRPQLKLKDALIFNLCFLLVFLTQNGYTLYAGFSVIHNYLFMSFFSLLFSIFYIRELWGRPACPFRSIFLQKTFPFLMLILGFIFGFASNVTPIVFLLTLPFYAIYLHLSKQKIHFKKFFFSWHTFSLLGVLAGLFFIYVVGHGLSDYQSSSDYVTTFDYLSLSDIFTSITSSIPRLFVHLVKNFGRFLLPFIIIFVPTAIITFKSRKRIKAPLFSTKEKNFLIATIIFIFIHILAFTQIIYPTRLILVAYLLAVSITVFFLTRLFSSIRLRISITATAIAFCSISIALLTIRTYFAIDYLQQVSPVFDTIQSSTENNICVDRSIISPKSIPVVRLSQDAFLADWAMPQTIYGKNISFCQ